MLVKTTVGDTMTVAGSLCAMVLGIKILPSMKGLLHCLVKVNQRFLVPPYGNGRLPVHVPSKLSTASESVDGGLAISMRTEAIFHRQRAKQGASTASYCCTFSRTWKGGVPTQAPLNTRYGIQ